MSENKVKQLKKQISELKSQWPKHTVPPGMIQQLDELEEELARELEEETRQSEADDDP